MDAGPGEHGKLGALPSRPGRVAPDRAAESRGLLARQGPDHAVVPRSAVGAKGLDLGMRIGAAHKRGVYGPGRADVVDVARAACQKADVLAASDARPDVLSRPQGHRPPPCRIT
jgi:hypothetical protein